MKPFLRIPFSLLALSGALALAHEVRAQIPDEELEALVLALESDDVAARYEARMSLQAHVVAAGAPGQQEQQQAVEQQLLAQLGQELSPQSRLWLLRQIAHIASEASVEPLSRLLNHDYSPLADSARMTLEANPSVQASEALLAGLQAAEDTRQIQGYIASLAERRYQPAVAAIAERLTSDDPAVVELATMGLGTLGGKAAVTALQRLRSSSQGELKAYAEQALLLASPKDYFLAQELAQEGFNRAIRAAGFQRCVQLRPRQAVRLMRSLLEGGDAAVNGDILSIALRSEKPALARAAIKDIESRSTAEQAIVAGGLTRDRSGQSEKIALAMAQSESEALQVQAIEALGRVGSATSLPTLMDALAARSREVRETAADALAHIADPTIDRQLLKAARSGEGWDATLAVQALSYRGSEDATTLINDLARSSESLELQREAIAAIERVGDVESIGILVDLIVDAPDARLRRDAQRTVKRLTLRTADPEAAWSAFAKGFEQAEDDLEARLALIAVADSAPTPEAIGHIKRTWADGDEQIRSAILRVLPAWRNWDAGFALIELAEQSENDPDMRASCFNAISRLILGSDPSYSFSEKYALAEAALSQAQTPAERQSVFQGFRGSDWRDRVYVTYNEVDAELKEAVLAFAKN